MFAVIETLNNRPLGCWVENSHEDAVLRAVRLCAENDLDVDASHASLERDGFIEDGDYTLSVVLVSS